MRFQIPKRIYVDRGKDEGKSKPVAFRLPERLLNELNEAAEEYGYPGSLFVSLILDGYLAQIQPATRVKYPEDLERKDLKAVSYRLDNTLLNALKAASRSRSLDDVEVLTVALWTFLKAQ